MSRLRFRRGFLRSPSGVSFDSDALAYFSTAGITDTMEKSAANAFIIGAKSAGLWDAFDRLYLMSPTSLSAARVCARTLDVAALSVNDPVHSNLGVFFGLGVDDATYFDTNLTPGFGPAGGPGHISVYPRTTAASGFYAGSTDALLTSTINIIRKTAAPNLVWNCYSTATNVSVNSGYTGLLAGDKHGGVSPTNKLFRNGSQIGSTNTNPELSFPSSQNIWIGNANFGGAATTSPEIVLSFASVGGELGATGHANLYTLVQAYQTNVIAGGRQI